MTEIKWTTHSGSKGRIWWPSLGLIRTWALMIGLDVLTPFPLQAPGFLVCWILVTLMRIAYNLISRL